MKSFDGYLKKKLGDSYVLLAGGGHKSVDSWLYVNNVTSLNADDATLGLYNVASGIVNGAHGNHSSLLSITNVGTPYQLQIPDSSVLYIYKRWKSSGVWSSWSKISAGYADSAGTATSATSATTATNLANVPELLIGTGNNVNKIAVKAGEKTSSYITVPYATNSNKSNIAYELRSNRVIADRLTTINNIRPSNSEGYGSTGMRLDLLTSSVTDAPPPSVDSASGYLHTYAWDADSAFSLVFIPNGDHIVRGDHIYIRGYHNDGTEWHAWKAIAYYDDISSVGDTRYVLLTKATLTITGSLIVTGGQMSIGCQVGDATYGKYHSLYMGYHSIDHMDFYEREFNFYANGGGTPTLKVNGSTIWHAGNDGSGSGLDADLLDGQHGSYYSPTTHTHSVQINGNNYTIPKSGDSAVNLGKYHPWATVSSLSMDTLAAGRYDCSVVPSGVPISNHGTVISVTNVGTPFEIYIADSSHPYIYKRYKSGGTWYSWFKLSAGHADSADLATNATNATYAGIAYELHSPTSVTGRLSSIDVVPSNSSGGRTRMRIDLVTSSLTSGIPNSNADAAGYVTTFGWDNSSAYAASQFYIPNGDHITRGDRVLVRGNDNGTWSGWYNLAYYSDILSIGDNRYVKKSGDTMTGTLIVNAGSSKFGPSLNDSTYKYYHALYLGTHGDDYMYFYERDFLFCYNGGSAQFKIEGSTSKVTSVHNIYAPNFYTTSDRSKKQNISSFSEHIRKFQLKDTEKWHYGVIAQEVPEMFRDGEEGNMTVNYNSILSFYIGQLENKVKMLEERIKRLESK